DLANQRAQVLTDFQEKYKSFDKELFDNMDKQIEVSEALDLIKRNYKWLDNMRVIAGSGFVRTTTGLAGAASYYEMAQGRPGTALALSQWANEKQEGVEEYKQGFRKEMQYDEINSLK